MWRLIASVLCVVFTTAFSGCVSDYNKICEENIIPEYAVGIWESDRLGWIFKIEPDGKIIKLKHMLAGTITAKEGGKSVDGPDEGTYAIFILGDCWAKYDYDKQELIIKISLAYMDAQLPYGRIQGRTEDYFIGKVTETTEQFKAEWRSYSWLEGANEPHKELIDQNPEILTFTKVEPQSFRKVMNRDQ